MGREPWELLLSNETPHGLDAKPSTPWSGAHIPSGVGAMPQNRIQYQEEFSLSEFFQKFGTEEKYVATLEHARWPGEFRCPR